MFRSCATIAIVCWASGLSAAEVRLRSSAVCPASVVRLGDIAEVLGEPNIASALADVTLCPSPAAGQERKLSHDEIRRLLALSGLERTDCVVTGSETVTITTGSMLTAGPRARQPLVASGVRPALFEAETTRTSEQPRAMKPASPEAPTPVEASKPTLVERGASVTVAARAAGVRITTSARALEAGKAGDIINVELAESKQRVLATVVGQQSVEVTH